VLQGSELVGRCFGVPDAGHEHLAVRSDAFMVDIQESPLLERLGINEERRNDRHAGPIAPFADCCGIDMILHGYFRSSAAYRCRIAFNLKGLSPQTAYVHLRKGEQRAPEFLALNPQGLVPALEVDGRLLTQSLAIVEWLEETHPSPPLLPSGTFDRAFVRSLALSIACDIHPLQNLRVLAQLRTTCALDQAGLDAWCRRWIEDGLAAFETQLEASGKAGRFCFGDEPTLADICLIPQVFSAARFGADIAGLATIGRIAANAATHPAFHAAHPSRQPDTEA
jgi:maleylacetoacetate isomerase